MKLNFKNVSSEAYDQLKGEMSRIGVEIEGDNGTISAKGVEGSYNRNAEANTLEITIDKTPFILSKNFVGKKIKEVVTKAGGEVV